MHTLPKNQESNRKKTPNAEHWERPGAHTKPAGGQLRTPHLYVNFTFLSGTQSFSLLFFVHFCSEHMPMRVVQPLLGQCKVKTVPATPTHLRVLSQSIREKVS